MLHSGWPDSLGKYRTMGDILVYPRITQEVRYWGPTASPLDGHMSFKIAFHIVWDEWMGAGEDPGITGGYRS